MLIQYRNLNKLILKITICTLLFCRLEAVNDRDSAKTGNAPNIVVVFTDDHGWGDLGAHGVLEDIKTPHLDILAREGVLFRSGYITAPQCVPSRAGLMAGQYQQNFGTDDNRYGPMPESVLTLPERLQRAGYITGMVGKWHLEPTRDCTEWLKKNTYRGKALPRRSKRIIPETSLLPYQPGNQGFTEFFSGRFHEYWANFDLKGNSLKPEGELYGTEKRDRLDIQTDAALAFIKRNHKLPFFLYLAYYAPHVPLASSEKYLSRFLGEMLERRRYALAMLSAVDEGVGRIRADLRERGLLDNTLFFFIGDNGAPLKITMEDKPIRFRGAAWDGSMNTPLRGEKGMLSEGGIRVPYLFSWPAKLAAGQVVDIPVTALDVAATSVSAAHLEIDDALDGEDLLCLLANPELAEQRPLYWRFWNQAAIRVDGWKYLKAGDCEYLFDIKKDMTESRNLIEKHPEVAKRLESLWEEWSRGLKRPYEGPALNEQETGWFDHYFK